MVMGHNPPAYAPDKLTVAVYQSCECCLISMLDKPVQELVVGQGLSAVGNDGEAKISDRFAQLAGRHGYHPQGDVSGLHLLLHGRGHFHWWIRSPIAEWLDLDCNPGWVSCKRVGRSVGGPDRGIRPHTCS